MQKFGNIEYIEGPNRGRYPFCNSLFVTTMIKAIIDPGSDQNRLRELASKGVAYVINSHYHEDHITYRGLFPERRCFPCCRACPATFL